MEQLPRLILATFHRDLRDLRAEAPAGAAGLLWRLRTVDRQIGGVQVQTEAFRSSLEQAGHQVVLVTPFDGSPLFPLLATLIGLPLRLVPRWAEGWRHSWHDGLLRASLRRVRHLLDGSTPAVVLAQCGQSAAAAQHYRGAAVPVVVVAH